MKIKVTLGDISDHGDWNAFCDLKGYDYYIMQRVGSEEEITLTPKEVIKIGLANWCRKQLKED
jgi:hypothetical protein